MASFLKRFYRKPPDGLLEICERVYVFDCCFATNAWTEQDYKVHIEGIVGQFRDHFQDSSILVFNFREGEEQSKLAKILSEYEMTIMDYPRQYEGCPLLTMEMIHHFLRSCESWLSLGQHNLLLMHCECGGWPILAFMLAALLIYRKLYSGEQKTLDMVYKQAPRELLHLLLPLNPMPSQLRYLQYVSRRNVATEWPPLDRALTLDCVIIRFIPNFDGDGGCRPIFRIYGQDPFLVNDRSPKVLFSTAKRSKAVRVYKQAESELVKIDINCHIQGDVVLEGINLSEDMEQEQMMFRVMFNTAFIRSNILMLNRDEIDTLWEAKDLFPKNFRIEILFSEMDAAASIVPVDLSCFEEKEGLPIEAFAKVQEIFSQVEWLSPKADAAINMIKQMNASSIFQEISDAKSDHGLESSALSAMKSFRKSLQRSNERIADIRTERRGSLSMDLEGQSILSSEPHWEREEEVAQTAKSAPDYHNSMNDLLTELSEDQTSAHTLAEDGKFQDVTSFERKEVMDLTAVSPDRIKSQLSDEHSDPKSVSILPMAPSPFQHGFSARAASTPPAPPLVLLPSSSLNLLGSKPENSPSAEKIHSPSEDKGDSSSAHLLSSTSRHSPPTTPPPPPLPPPQGMQTPASLDKEAVSHLQDTTKGSLASFAAEPLSHSPPPLPDSSFPTSTVQQSSKQPPPPTPLLTDNQPANMTPPRPPPSPPHSNQAVLQSSKPPPPPTPPLNDNQPAKMRPPPPPPPPSSSSQPMSPEVSTAVPPPPAPPAPPMSRQAETISKNSPQVPSAPPPPTPTAKGVSRASTGSPSPVPPSLSGLSAAKGRGLSRGTNLKANSTKKLKPLHWLKLSRAVQGSIWAEAQKSGEATKAPEIDMSELETLFSASVPVSDRSRKSSLRSSDGRKPEIVQLIDHRRAYNCEIMLSKVKVPLHELMNSVLSLEDSALDVDQVENLIKFCPTKEEMELLKGYTGDKEKLGRCEQFFLELMQVPRVESKLRVFSFKIQFLTQVADLRKNLNIVNSAAEEIKNSVKLKRVMQTILQLGNALNQGTARGAAIGFRLDSLLKLTDTRARNNKMTLMHYLCKVLADKLPEVIDFSKDLTHLEPASKVQLKFLAEEMQAISKGLEKVMQELSLSDNDGPVSQNFCKILKDFLRFAEAEVRSLASLYSGVGKNVDSLILYFGEDPARCPFEQVVSTLLNFQRMFNKAHEENCKQIEVEMKKAAESDKSKLNASHKDADHSFQTALLTSDVR